jgi:hypothetical protein
MAHLKDLNACGQSVWIDEITSRVTLSKDFSGSPRPFGTL